jgi:hypothetical protein
MRYRYDHRVAIAGLVLGLLILAGGLLTGYREEAGAWPWPPSSPRPLVAYVRLGGRPGPDREGR